MNPCAPVVHAGTSSDPSGDVYYKRCKLINDLFGSQKGRGHGVLREAPPDTRFKGLEGKTVSLEDATVYVFNEWCVKQEWVSASIAKKSWKQLREEWKGEGLGETEQLRREGEAMQQMLRGLPVFVFKGLPGAYYSETQLKYATGLSAHPFRLYQMMRDAKRGEGPGQAEEGEGGGDWGALGDREDPLEGFVAEEEGEGEGVGVGGLIKAIGYGAAAAAEEGGMAVSSSSGGLKEVLKVGLGDLCAADRTPDNFAKVVVRSAVSLGLSVEGSMRRALWQYEAVGKDSLALRREFLAILAEAANHPPELTEPQAASGEATQGGEGKGAGAEFGEGTVGEEEEEEVEEEEEEEEGSEDEGSVDLEKEEQEEVGGWQTARLQVARKASPLLPHPLLV